MNPLLLDVLAAAPIDANQPLGLGMTVLFYCTAIIMVVCALAVALAKEATHSAIAMVGVMLGLAVLYFSQGAVFLSVVQVVVYTGAIMVLFLFVLMMVGVSASDNYQKTSPALRYGAWALGIIGAGLLITTFIVSPMASAPQAKAPVVDEVSNPVNIAFTIFSDHIFTMQMTGVLLILAALAAVTLTHSDALTVIKKQPETAEARMQAYAASGIHPGQMPAPGVYAGHNAPDSPALSGEDMSPLKESIPRVIRAQDFDRPLAQVAPTAVEHIRAEKMGHPEDGMLSIAASQAVKHSTAWGMPGDSADMSLAQPETRDVRPKAVGGGDAAPKAIDNKEKEADQ